MDRCESGLASFEFRFKWNLGGNEYPGVLESLRFIPQGWQKVAGGRSIAETTGMVLNENRILEGCQRFPQRLEAFWHPCGMHCIVPIFPEVSAALRPPATVCHPFGMNRKSRIESVRFLSSPKIPNEPEFHDSLNSVSSRMPVVRVVAGPDDTSCGHQGLIAEE